MRVLFDPLEKLLHLLVDSFIHEAELIFISHSQVVGGAWALNTEHCLVLGDHSLVVLTELLVLFKLLKHKRLDFFLHLVNVDLFLSLVNWMLRSRGTWWWVGEAHNGWDWLQKLLWLELNTFDSFDFAISVSLVNQLHFEFVRRIDACIWNERNLRRLFRNPFTIQGELFYLKFEARLSVSSSLESLKVAHFSVHLNMLHDAVCLPPLGLVFRTLPLGSHRLNLVLLVPSIKHRLPLQCLLKLLH